jgi:hypothetical protein
VAPPAAAQEAAEEEVEESEEEQEEKEEKSPRSMCKRERAKEGRNLIEEHDLV